MGDKAAYLYLEFILRSSKLKSDLKFVWGHDWEYNWEYIGSIYVKHGQCYDL